MEQDYFLSFMEEVIRDLKNKKEAFVFNEEQVAYIKKRLNNIEIRNDDGIFYITNLSQNIDKEKSIC